MRKRYPVWASQSLLLMGLSIPTVHAQDSASLPVYDTHVHYNSDAWADYPLEEVIQKFENANVPRALVSSISGLINYPAR